MLINEKGLVKVLKREYKATGYKIIQQDRRAGPVEKREVHH